MARDTDKYIALNRRARHDYFIEDTLEAGVVLQGPEVKSLRKGGASITESHAGEMGGEIWLFNAHIQPYKASREKQEERRPRKLLLSRRERSRLFGAIKRDGITLVPLSLYFNERGFAKLELGVAKGKRKVDKREATKERDWQRQKARVMRRDD